MKIKAVACKNCQYPMTVRRLFWFIALASCGRCERLEIGSLRNLEVEKGESR